MFIYEDYVTCASDHSKCQLQFADHVSQWKSRVRKIISFHFFNVLTCYEVKAWSLGTPCKRNLVSKLHNSHVINFVRVCTCAYQGVKNVRFSENLTYFVFLKHPFWDSPFYIIADEVWCGQYFPFLKQSNSRHSCILTTENGTFFRKKHIVGRVFLPFYNVPNYTTVYTELL